MFPLSLTILAFICTSVPALLLKKWSDRNLGSLTVIAIALLAGGIIMWAVDAWSTRYEPTTVHVEEIGLGQSVCKARAKTSDVPDQECFLRIRKQLDAYETGPAIRSPGSDRSGAILECHR